MAKNAGLLILSLSFLFVSVAVSRNVTFDHRSLIIDGQRKLLISASIHYPRSVPAMWPDLVATAKRGGADVIETYVFWNGHEPSPGQFYFEDRFDLVKFAKIVRDAGMYMILRIGPFVAAEWNYGGVPVWLHYVPGTVFRTDSEPFKSHMASFTTYIVNMMKRENLFASQGGHIILAQAIALIFFHLISATDQIENEYEFTEAAYGAGGRVQNFGTPKPHRPPEDIAFAVARFFQKGGSLQNYYMYHGGTNFGRTSGGPFITTSYDYDAPIDEYGLVRLPKWSHLKELHEAIKLCEQTLLYGTSKFQSLGPHQEADIFEDSSGKCVAFLANVDEQNDTSVIFQNVSYNIPAWSVSILPDCKNVVFNTAKVRSQNYGVEMVPENLKAYAGSGKLPWQVHTEKAGVWGAPDFVKNELVDHINTTKDTTDYLWYTTSFYMDGSELISNGSSPNLMVESKGHALQAFINGRLQASSSGYTIKLATPITLTAGINEIALLSMTVGLQNGGPFYEWVGAGITSVKISGLRNGSLDLSKASWAYKIGLEGEHQNIFKADGSHDVWWTTPSDPPKNQPLTWYKVEIAPPQGNEPVALDMQSMGKGQAWLNGKGIGRYWSVTNSAYYKCAKNCDYRGSFSPSKCRTGCGEISQRWYHVPRSWFLPSGRNTLVFLEEKGGDPTKITFARRRVTTGAPA
ncbi:hypothetical protein OPV22_020761 [Ensete ventricosum]|uniref:beta-galactosidase n=1 Tax=Ensete ventricosum TaxID=4639 RepID=A0AAV8QB88_ENSVE|nr:hypothetical protein OPV22_020761 [Ensete ventricosum]